MKNHIIYSIVFLVGILLVAQGSFAQASNKNQRQLHINSKGDVNDDKGVKLGYITKEDMVYDSQGKKLGFIKNGKVYDAEGNYLGKSKKNGRYYNNEGVFVLKTKTTGEKCEILDPEGHKKGTVHKNYKLHACATHCFFKEKEQKKSN